MNMAKETGADLIKIVETKLGKTIKFIVMAGHASPKVEKNGIYIALYPFLRKPLDINNLIEQVASVLETNEKKLWLQGI